MPCPRFTKVVINHFISKDNTISMRNQINLYTIRDDSLLGTLKFVAKTKDCQKYGALIPDGMINKNVKDSKTYKTYYNFATRKVKPKKARKFKKPTSPRLKTVSSSPKEHTQKGKRAKRSTKKTSTTSIVGVMKKALKKSKRETHKLQASCLNKGANFESKVPDESTGKPKDTSEGTDMKPGILDVSTKDSSDSKAESWGDSKEESDDVNDEDENDDDNEEDDMDNDDGDNDNDDEGNDDEGSNEDSDQTYSGFVQKEEDAHVTLTTVHDKTEGPLQISSISSDFTSKLLNLDVPSSDINSLMKTSIVPPPPLPVYPSSHPTTIPQQQKPDSTTTTTYPTMTHYNGTWLRSQVRVSAHLRPPLSQEEPEFEAADIEMHQDQRNEFGHIDDQPDNEVAHKHDWFLKPDKPPTLDRAWNKSKSVDFIPPRNGSAPFPKNVTKKDNLLIWPTFNLLKGTCKSIAKLEYHFKECYKAVNDRLDWHNPKGREYPFDLSKPLLLIEDQGRQVVPADYFINNDLEYLNGGSSISKYATSTSRTMAAKYNNIKGREDMVPTLWSPVKVAYNNHRRIIMVTSVKVMRWYDYGYLEEIVVRRDDNMLYKFKEDDFPRLNLCDIEDMQLLLV
nr:hypothetical protein [Tanacetum cinerariifolium]